VYFQEIKVFAGNIFLNMQLLLHWCQFSILR